MKEMNYCQNITEMVRLLIILNYKSIVLNPDSSILKKKGFFQGKRYEIKREVIASYILVLLQWLFM
jgi:hypothetical protein